MTAEPALKLVDTNETGAVEQKALTILDQAGAVVVTDSETYTAAGTLWNQLGDMIKEVKDTFDPICDATNKAHKAATAKRAKYLDPLTTAYRSVKGLMEEWDREQERKRQEEQRRLEEIARKEEEERQLLEAIAAEEAAKEAGATEEEAAQVAEAVMAEPVAVAPVVIPKAVPKLQGGPVYREVWAAEVTDIKALCLAVGQGTQSTEFVMGLNKDKKSGKISSPALNTLSTSLKSTMNVPGVRAYSRRV